MTDRYLIRIKHGETMLEWARFDPQGILIEGPHKNSIPFVQSKIKKANVILLLPSHDVLLTDITLPAASKKKQKMALPYLLENELVNNIEDVEIALGKPDTNNKLPVAIIEKHKLDAYLEDWKLFRKNIVAATPDVLYLPLKENTHSIFIEKDIAYVKTSNTSGFACSEKNLKSFLSSVRDHIAIDKRPAIVNFSYDKKPASNGLMQTDLQLEKNHKTYFELLDNNIPLEPPLNLLSKRFSKRKPSKKLFLTMCTLAIIAVLLPIINLILEDVHLTQAKRTLDQEITRHYKTIFPNAAHITAPKLRIERALKNHKQTNTSLFLSLSSVLDIMKKQVPMLTVHAIEFENNTLKIQTNYINKATADQLEEIAHQNKLTLRFSSEASTNTLLILERKNA